MEYINEGAYRVYLSASYLRTPESAPLRYTNRFTPQLLESRVEDAHIFHQAHHCGEHKHEMVMDTNVRLGGVPSD